mgnify:CR=1 FL=1
MFTVSQFNTKVTGKLHGTTLNKITDVKGKIGEAADNMLLRVFPLTTIRRARIENAIYDKVTSYVINQDVQGNDGIIDIRPVGGERSDQDYTDGRFPRDFDIKKEKNTMAIEVINGVKTLRLSKPLNARTTLFEANSLTLDGTVTASGDASNLTVDELDYISGNASLRFDLDGLTGTGNVEITLSSAIDLSTMEDIGALFNWLKFPTVSRLTSYTLRWGSSSGAYWYKTVTAPHDRSAFEDEIWSLMRYDWKDATQVGTPDASAITYLEVIVNYTVGTALTAVRLDSFTAAIGEAWEIVYYSNCYFTDTTGATWKNTPTADSDIIMLDPEAINILIYEFGKVIIQEAKGKNMKADFEYYDYQLEGSGRKPGLYMLHNQKYPSQTISLQETYYEFNDFDV